MGSKSFLFCAKASLVSVLVLIFVGAIVRVTGAGMGCPDWPTCWGCLIPPTKVEEVEFEKLDIAKFQRKAERMGRDPSTISVESLRAEFNPRHVWTEFINRLFSLPVGLFSLLTVVFAFGAKERRSGLYLGALLALILVLINAWMGARVVYSGLAPGVLTTHMALAFLLILVQTFLVHRATQQTATQAFADVRKKKRLLGVVLVLFFVVLAEGIMGSQVRELTDAMSKHLSQPRSEWGEALEQSWLYLTHRSFSWIILFLAVYAWWLAKRYRISPMHLSERLVIGIVLTQMVLGVVMSQVHIYGWVQVLHVGLAAILVSSNFYWVLLLAKSDDSSEGESEH
jgi:cytochrome c oxidase assembly protein subunit 15